MWEHLGRVVLQCRAQILRGVGVDKHKERMGECL
jgi:hypothetical protein